jgi:hypothetical protein
LPIEQISKLRFAQSVASQHLRSKYLDEGLDPRDACVVLERFFGAAQTRTNHGVPVAKPEAPVDRRPRPAVPHVAVGRACRLGVIQPRHLDRKAVQPLGDEQRDSVER